MDWQAYYKSIESKYQTKIMYKNMLFTMLMFLAISCQNKTSTSNPTTTKNILQANPEASDYMTSTDHSIDRVAVAREQKSEIIESNLSKHDLNKKDLNILIVAYKNADELHVYGKSKDEKSYKIIKSYPVCSRSGELGPKKAEGDKQVPEGFYHIDRFNAKSLFYLSLGINYPNQLDKSLGYTGSDIFIHGKCVTIGCLPMTDEWIKEIYLYALYAKDAGQRKIPVYIFPFEMTDENIEKYTNKVDSKTIAFWKNIQEGYKLFQTNQQALNFDVNNGKYVFK